MTIFGFMITSCAPDNAPDPCVQFFVQALC
jgi:hypothetical protein